MARSVRGQWQLTPGARSTRIVVQVEDLQPLQAREVRHGRQRVVAEVQRAPSDERAVPRRDRRQAELARVQPLEPGVGAVGETAQPSYSPSRVKIRRMIATDDAYVESRP